MGFKERISNSVSQAQMEEDYGNVYSCLNFMDIHNLILANAKVVYHQQGLYDVAVVVGQADRHRYHACIVATDVKAENKSDNNPKVVLSGPYEYGRLQAAYSLLQETERRIERALVKQI